MDIFIFLLPSFKRFVFLCVWETVSPIICYIVSVIYVLSFTFNYFLPSYSIIIRC